MLHLHMVGVHWNSQCKVQKDVDASKGGHHQAKNKQNKSITEEKRSQISYVVHS